MVSNTADEAPLAAADEVDPLTGLLTFASFRPKAQAFLDNPPALGPAPSIVYFNVENMKLYNERFGLVAGDELLAHVARAIESSFPQGLVSRVGDDRFVLITCDDSLADGIERVYHEVRDHNDAMQSIIRAGVYEHDGHADVTLSCDRAKMACDHIRGRYDVFWRQYDEALFESIERRQRILGKFDDAMRLGHIQVYFQPIFRTIGTKVCEFEALARWIDPDEGFISPADFIPVLEDARLIHRFDLHIIETVCRQFSIVLKEGYPLAPANVNLSKLDMELCDIVAETDRLMRMYNVPANILNIEITESVFSNDNEVLQDTIRRFHDLGLQVWMDDFGSGYSSLNALRDYPFDVVKFDLAFLRNKDAESAAKARLMLSHVTSMMKDLGYQTLAEGVETKEQLDFLAEIGCEKVQGFYFAKPAPLGEFAKRVMSGEFEVEAESQRAYMNEVGRVNLMATSTVGLNLDRGMELSSSVPASIVEFHAGTVRYLAWNDSYVEYLRDIGMNSIENSTVQMNDKTRTQSQGFFAASEKLRGKPDWMDIAFYEEDDLCTGRARCIAYDEQADTCAFVFVATNISKLLARAGYNLGA